ncbi:MAG TPA: DUF192 domain-containing protein [Bryobacteraceae bacterium]|nr:DUF192 domain-containing protein [Bryobacteraceae bacterium]
MRYQWLGCLLLLAASCGPRTVNLEDFEKKDVKLPNGQIVRAEVMIKLFDLQRGMMFRESLPQGHGLLFVHPKPGLYPYFMYQVNVPLDIIWMDANRRIVEIVPDAQPCHTRASLCPTYGGKQEASFVLELGAGEARRYGLQTGNTLTF